MAIGNGTKCIRDFLLITHMFIYICQLISTAWSTQCRIDKIVYIFTISVQTQHICSKQLNA